VTHTLAHFRHAVRLLTRTPLFTATAVLSLAIGIGANTTIFTAANALLAAPPRGVAHPERLLDIGASRHDSGFDTTSFPAYEAVRTESRLLDGVYAYSVEPKPFSLGRDSGAERVYGQMVSAGYFNVLGVTPAAGTFFTQADEKVGVPLRRVVLSHGLWQRDFGGDADVVGRTVTINGDAFVVAGVASAGFQGTTVLAPDLWVPLTAYATAMPTEAMTRQHRTVWLVMVGRMRPGVTIDQVRAELGAIDTSLKEEAPDAYADKAFVVAPLSRLPGVGSEFVGPFMAVLMAVVGVVLLIACTNLAGLMLARAAARSREIAVRLALGATRANLVWQLLTEGLVLFAAGGLAGLGLARLMTAALVRLLPALPVPIGVDFPFDARVLAFAIGLSLVTGALTALVPALQSTKTNLVPALKDEESAPARQRLRHAFVAGQMALCLLLMVVAGLFLRALGAAVDLDPGFRIAGIEVANLDLGLGGYVAERGPDVAAELGARLASIPGVEQVGMAAVVPLAGDGLGMGSVKPEGRDNSDGGLRADWNIVSPEYFTTLDIPIVAGRDFTSADRKGAVRAGIVNERLARVAWPGQDPIGRVIDNEDGPITVVGVARDARYRSLGDEPRNFLYIALAQQPWLRVSYFVRRSSTGGPDLPTAIRGVVRDFNRNLPVVSTMALSEYANLGLIPQRLAASVAGSLGAVALLLAAVGIYGLTAFSVARRTREIGLRMALGADRGRVLRMVVGQSARLTMIGASAGLLLAAGASQLISSLLFGVSTVDPWAFVGMPLALAAVATVASLAPALHAARIDPLVALRTD
jgi:putative ABC transport system permease protein